jgi:SAM-dependent methyltransferase
MVEYDQAFYIKVAETARQSARHIVPIVLTYIEPRSVIDIGCGTGTWLSVFEEYGISDVLGIDGDFVPKELLEIPTARYVAFDLAQPFHCARRFDLVISLEVAEHLPSDCAASFVDSLVRLGPAVLFSAAIPGQGGTHHINEQWQDYWAALFRQYDYVAMDCVRSKVWDNSEVAWWYSQNTLLYCERNYVMKRFPLFLELESTPKLPLRIVHPHKFQEAVWLEHLARAAAQLGRAIPPGSAFLLIDGGAAGAAFHCCGQAIPFPQKDGVFAGNPVDSRHAIAEMHSVWDSASHVVIVEPVFWWLSCYSEWFDNLLANSQTVLDTDIIKVFELTSRTHSPKGSACD